MKPVRIGIGGPVGAGKTQLVERITRALQDEFSMAAITNDIYTIEDAKILAANGVLPLDRIIGIETGGCPHTAIREDTSMNEAAIAELKRRHGDLDIVFVESGGDNLSATFSPELVDFSMYIIDVAQGEKIPRKAGQGMIKSDFFVINKTDLAPLVGADLDVMAQDSREFRGDRPFGFTNLKTDEGLDAILQWIRRDVMMADLASCTPPSGARARSRPTSTSRERCAFCVPTTSTTRGRSRTRS
jgi:urease accessory protein